MRYEFHILNVFMGLLAGLICALGGALKDSPYEGFKPLTFLRSIWVGTLGGVFSCFVTANPYVAFCVSGYLERFLVEGWKIVRHRKPGKFDREEFKTALPCEAMFKEADA
jgi:hypothetical protein